MDGLLVSAIGLCFMSVITAAGSHRMPPDSDQVEHVYRVGSRMVPIMTS